MEQFIFVNIIAPASLAMMDDMSYQRWNFWHESHLPLSCLHIMIIDQLWLPFRKLCSSSMTLHLIVVYFTLSICPPFFISPQVPDTIAQGQWLNVLIRETGCADRPPTNGRAADPSPPADDEDIYCDVDDDTNLLTSWNLGPRDISCKEVCYIPLFR